MIFFPSTMSAPPSKCDPRVKQWEKDRRDRFNQLLAVLANTLPDPDPKWSKKEIVERAVARIKTLEAEKMPEDVQKKIRIVARQNRKLREVIRREFDLRLKESEFRNLSLAQIREVIGKKRAESEKFISC